VLLKRAKTLRILDFDIENRPLSYLGSDFTTAEITAIAWSWYGETKVHCRLLEPTDEMSNYTMLLEFVDAYDQADVVTGHYIRNHDLPIINGSLMELELKPLDEKLSSDTKNDLLKRSGVSASQESLSGMYGLKEPKYHMSQPRWREANRLTPEGLEQTRKRVTEDVKQHKALRARLIENEMLGPPRVWRP
jgi:hypothetical protein